MDLLLWRHAEAVDGFPDSERKLTLRGEEQARRMAAWLRTHAPKNMRILASPARRCQQTAQALGLPFETDVRLSTDNNVADLLAAADWPDGDGQHDAVLVVAHQPTLGHTAALLLSGSKADWSVRKGAVWWFTSRTKQGETQAVLRLVTAPEFA